MSYLRSQKGFTLLEIMLTAIIFVSALIPVLSLYSTGFVSSFESEITTRVLNHCRERMEEIKSAGYFSIEEGEESLNIPPFNFENVNRNFSDSDFVDGIRVITQVFYVDRENNKTEIDYGLKKIVVVGLVKEKDGKKTKRIELFTLLSR